MRLPSPGMRQVEGPREPSAAGQPGPPARRILIVDDNQDNAESLAMLLRLAGNDVHTAHDAEASPRSRSRAAARSVLLDIGMPKVNGYEAARRIREQPWGRDIVLVALTGLGQEQDLRRPS